MFKTQCEVGLLISKSELLHFSFLLLPVAHFATDFCPFPLHLFSFFNSFSYLHMQMLRSALFPARTEERQVCVQLQVYVNEQGYANEHSYMAVNYSVWLIIMSVET